MRIYHCEYHHEMFHFAGMPLGLPMKSTWQMALQCLHFRATWELILHPSLEIPWSCLFTINFPLVKDTCNAFVPKFTSGASKVVGVLYVKPSLCPLEIKIHDSQMVLKAELESFHWTRSEIVKVQWSMKIGFKSLRLAVQAFWKSNPRKRKKNNKTCKNQRPSKPW